MKKTTRARPGQPAGQRRGNGASWICWRILTRGGRTAQSASGGRHQRMLAPP